MSLFVSRAPRIRRALVLSSLAAGAACSEDPSRVSPVEPATEVAFAKGGAGNSRPILFESDAETPGLFQIYSLDPSTKAVARLTRSSVQDLLPAWSSDGKRILFTRVGEGIKSSIIYIMNADGLGITPLTSGGALDFNATWSKDNRIAFVSTRASADPSTNHPDSTDVYVMNPDGSGISPLVRSPRADMTPVWSPDARQLAFVSDRDALKDSLKFDIYVANVDRIGTRRLTTLQADQISAVSWSPDGRSIAFSPVFGNSSDVYVIRADGTQLKQITFDGKSGHPSWSPDGNLLVYAGSQPGAITSELFTMRPDGTGVTPMTNTPNGNDLFPAWYR